MKRNLSILLVVLMLLSAMLACGSETDTGSSGGGSIAGAWENDNDNTVGVAFGDDGSYGIYKSGELMAEGTYTFDGSTVVTTPSDGSGETSAQVEINGGTMTMTDPDGRVSVWTKK